jgi:hypothetical protein
MKQLDLVQVLGVVGAVLAIVVGAVIAIYKAIKGQK